jgi:lysophospholipase L1-like esterase
MAAKRRIFSPAFKLYDEKSCFQLPEKRRKHYRLRPRFFVITGTALLLLITGILLLVRSCGQENTAPVPEEPPQENSESSSEEEGDSRYLVETLFTGDSRTRGMATYGFVPQRQVLAIDGLNHLDARQKPLFSSREGSECTLAEAVGERAPKRVMISFGINGMNFIEEEEYFSEYEGLVDDIIRQSPESCYILQAIYPVSAEFSEENPAMSNETIDRYNERLKKLADEKSLFFLNTAEALKDEKGALPEEYDAGDGLHLSREAYKVIIRYVREHPAPAEEEKSQ